MRSDIANNLKKVTAAVMVLALSLCGMNKYCINEMQAASNNWPQDSDEEMQAVYEIANNIGKSITDYVQYSTEEDKTDALKSFNEYFNYDKSDEGVLMLNKDIKVTDSSFITMNRSYSYTLDLNGYTITGDVNNAVIVVPEVTDTDKNETYTITIKDSSYDSAGKIENINRLSNSGIFDVYSQSIEYTEDKIDINIEDGQYECAGGVLLRAHTNADVVITDGVYTCNGSGSMFSIYDGSGNDNGENAGIKIVDGTYTAADSCNMFANMTADSHVEVCDGDFTSYYGAIFKNIPDDADLEVNDGKFVSNMGDVLSSNNNIAGVNITGGIFNAEETSISTYEGASDYKTLDSVIASGSCAYSVKSGDDDTYISDYDSMILDKQLDGRNMYDIKNIFAVNFNNLFDNAENIDLTAGNIIITDTGYTVTDENGEQLISESNNLSHRYWISGDITKAVFNTITIEGSQPKTVMLDRIISGSKSDSDLTGQSPVTIGNGADVTLIPYGNNTLYSLDAPAVKVGDDSNLTIQGNGFETLNAYSRDTYGGGETGESISNTIGKTYNVSNTIGVKDISGKIVIDGCALCVSRESTDEGKKLADAIGGITNNNELVSGVETLRAVNCSFNVLSGSLFALKDGLSIDSGTLYCEEEVNNIINNFNGDKLYKVEPVIDGNKVNLPVKEIYLRNDENTIEEYPIEEFSMPMCDANIRDIPLNIYIPCGYNMMHIIDSNGYDYYFELSYNADNNKIDAAAINKNEFVIGEVLYEHLYYIDDTYLSEMEYVESDNIVLSSSSCGRISLSFQDGKGLCAYIPEGSEDDTYTLKVKLPDGEFMTTGTLEKINQDVIETEQFEPDGQEYKSIKLFPVICFDNIVDGVQYDDDTQYKLYYRSSGESIKKVRDPEKEGHIFAGWIARDTNHTEGDNIGSISSNNDDISNYVNSYIILSASWINVSELYDQEDVTESNMTPVNCSWCDSIKSRYNTEDDPDEYLKYLPALKANLNNDVLNCIEEAGYTYNLNWKMYNADTSKDNAVNIEAPDNIFEDTGIYIPQTDESGSLLKAGTYNYFAEVIIRNKDGDIAGRFESSVHQLNVGKSDLIYKTPVNVSVEYTGESIKEESINDIYDWTGRVKSPDNNNLVLGTDYIVAYSYRKAGDTEGVFTDGLPSNAGSYALKVNITPIGDMKELYREFTTSDELLGTLTINKKFVNVVIDEQNIEYCGKKLSEVIAKPLFSDGHKYLNYSDYSISYYYAQQGEKIGVNGLPDKMGVYDVYAVIKDNTNNYAFNRSENTIRDADGNNMPVYMSKFKLTYSYESCNQNVSLGGSYYDKNNNEIYDTDEFFTESAVTVSVPDGYEMFILSDNIDDYEKFRSKSPDETAEIYKAEGAEDNWSSEPFSITKDGNYYYVYSLRNIKTGDITEAREVSFSIDTKAPTNIKISSGSSAWEKFLETITFTIYAPETQTIDITGGEDENSAEVFYYIRSTDKDGKQFTNVEALEQNAQWVKYDSSNAPKIDQNIYAVIYAKAVDLAGNTTYASTDGILRDDTGLSVTLKKDGVVKDNYLIEIEGKGEVSGNINKTMSIMDGEYYSSAEPGNYSIFVNEKLAAENIEKQAFNDKKLTINYYTVTFYNYKDDNTVGSEYKKSVLENKKLSEMPESLVIDGYVFAGWTKDDINESLVNVETSDGTKTIAVYNDEIELFDKDSEKITETTSLYAVWKPETPIMPQIRIDGNTSVYGDETNYMKVWVNTDDVNKEVITYQWYQVASEDDESEGSIIPGAVLANYRPEELSDFGTYYYYCKVKSTLGDISVHGRTDIARYVVSKRPLSSGYIKISKPDKEYPYTGKEVKVKPGAMFILNNSEHFLEEGTDFYYEYSNNIETGTANVTIKAVSNSNFTDADENVSFKYDIVRLNTDKSASLNGESGLNGWYTSMVSILAPDGCEISKDEKNWSNRISNFDDGQSSVKYYLRDKVYGYIYNEKFIEVRQDMGEPYGTVNIGSGAWDSFLSAITFGIYTSKQEKVVINGSDEISGIDKIDYVLSTNIYKTSEELEAAVTSGIEKYIDYKSKEELYINKDSKTVVYARFYDRAGHKYYVSSDGVIEDEKSPEITAEINEANTSINVTVADDNLKSVNYKIGSYDLVNPDNMESFTIPLEEDGIYNVVISAKDKLDHISTKSVSVNKDTIAPEATDVMAYSLGEQSGRFELKLSEDATLYYALIESSELSAPIVDVLKSGINRKCSKGKVSIDLYNLKYNTKYDIYYILVDNAGNAGKLSTCSFTAEKGVLTGKVSISGQTVYGSTLSVTTSDIINTASALKYSWYREGEEEPVLSGKGSNALSYIITNKDINKKITVIVSADNCNNTISAVTLDVCRPVKSSLSIITDIDNKTEIGDQINVKVILDNTISDEKPEGTFTLSLNGKTIESGVDIQYKNSKWQAEYTCSINSCYLNFEAAYTNNKACGYENASSSLVRKIKYNKDKLEVEPGDSGKLPEETGTDGLKGWSDGTTLYIPGADFINDTEYVIELKAEY